VVGARVAAHNHGVRLDLMGIIAEQLDRSQHQLPRVRLLLDPCSGRIALPTCRADLPVWQWFRSPVRLPRAPPQASAAAATAISLGPAAADAPGLPPAGPRRSQLPTQQQQFLGGGDGGGAANSAWRQKGVSVSRTASFQEWVSGGDQPASNSHATGRRGSALRRATGANGAPDPCHELQRVAALARMMVDYS